MHNHVGNYHMTIGDLKLFSIEFINRLILTVSGKIPLEDVHILDIIVSIWLISFSNAVS